MHKLESIPNDVIDQQSVECEKDSETTAGGLWVRYHLKFEGNPGQHKTPQVIVRDEAGRHTLRDVNTNEFLGLETAVVYDTGVTGEFYDFFGKKCGITVSIVNPADFYEMAPADGGYGLTNPAGASEKHIGEVQRALIASEADARALKECLSDSDGVPSNNEGVENWDPGFFAPVAEYGPGDVNGNGKFADGSSRDIEQAVPGQFPHLVKLVVAGASSVYDGGVYTIMTWHPNDQNFVLSAAVDENVAYEVRVSSVSSVSLASSVQDGVWASLAPFHVEHDGLALLP